MLVTLACLTFWPVVQWFAIFVWKPKVHENSKSSRGQKNIYTCFENQRFMKTPKVHVHKKIIMLVLNFCSDF